MATYNKSSNKISEEMFINIFKKFTKKIEKMLQQYMHKNYYYKIKSSNLIFDFKTREIIAEKILDFIQTSDYWKFILKEIIYKLNYKSCYLKAYLYVHKEDCENYYIIFVLNEQNHIYAGTKIYVKQKSIFCENLNKPRDIIKNNQIKEKEIVRCHSKICYDFTLLPDI